MDTVYTQRTIGIDLLDGVLDSCLAESLNLIIIEHIERLALSVLSCERVREQPVLGNDLAQLVIHYTAVAGQCHIDGSCLIQNRHNSYVYRHGNTGGVDSVQPVLELLHIPAKLSHDVVSAVVLLLLQNRDIGLQASACDVSLRGTCYSDLKLIAKLVANELYKVCSVLEITTGSGLAQRNISTESQNMIYALIQVLLQLILHAFLGVLDYGKVGNRCSASVLNHLTYLAVCSYVSAACAVCTGNVIRLILAQMLDRARKILHTLLSLRRENLERQRHALVHDVC